MVANCSRDVPAPGNTRTRQGHVAKRDSRPEQDMRLTKIDVAEAHIISAVQLCFGNGHPASVYHLASAAREILTTIGQKRGDRTMLAGISESGGIPMKELIAAATEHAGFFKHANRDPTAVLEGFTERDAYILLFVACHDFGRIAKGQPIEAQVFEAWWFAQAFEKVREAPLRVQEIVRGCIRLFPGVRTANKDDKLKIGLAALEKARADPRFKMEIMREVVLQ